MRELSDDSLKPRDEDTWRMAIDYPFDVDGKTPNDDLARLQDFIATGAMPTLVWFPAFLSRDSLKDLGTLVILDHILTGERFAGVSAHLSPVDRAQARSLLENHRVSFARSSRSRLKAHTVSLRLLQVRSIRLTSCRSIFSRSMVGSRSHRSARRSAKHSFTSSARRSSSSSRPIPVSRCRSRRPRFEKSGRS